MSTFQILRAILLGSCFTSPVLSRPALGVMRWMAHSNSVLLNPDRNPILNAIVKPLIYDQFCAGTHLEGIRKTTARIKGMGYTGVILCYGKEAQVLGSNIHATGEKDANMEAGIEHFKLGNLKTLDMAESGDWLGIKMTGAGSEITQALIKNEEMPASFRRAMQEICEKARQKDCRIWIDAEQQVVQGAIDAWTIELQREFNRDRALLYNTLQAYLKGSRPKLEKQLAIAREEGWTLAIKLVRGAYMSTENRELIHDTKEDTDNSYNSIVRDLLGGNGLGIPPNERPKVQLFLAGHNPESIAKAANLIKDLSSQDRLAVLPDFGQLQGMADEIGCKLLQHCEGLKGSGTSLNVPHVYKCLTWGSVQECMQYLHRRVVENAGNSARMTDGMTAYTRELKRRMFGLGS
ncbi:FAD-linked oxidoreductase [Myriangium duriaei CBS 260.36]|uniref:Proline dehydrogenase n=1 Tax=Myriangium duriaei CBS 260.36 TaxID=1168546 RepID=A0A9P4J1V6_9PEZI|nr:FAD-linked oxidoreductase [Myriangium duriaei CBS 260.36]